MFEAAELGASISKADYEAREPKLHEALLEAQFALSKTKFPVVVIVSGSDGAGKGEFIHRLNRWFDPRGVETHAFWQSSDEENERPCYWRYWRALPGRGRIGIFLGSWYTDPIVKRVYGKSGNDCLDRELDRIAFFEKMLVDDGAAIVKVWFHLIRKAQKRALKELEEDPTTHYRVQPADWKQLKLYDKFKKVSERAIRETDTGEAPWHVIEACDRRYRELTAGEVLLKALQERIGTSSGSVKKKEAKPHPFLASTRSGTQNVLDHVDLDRKFSDREYEKELTKYQGKLSKLVWAANEKKISMVAAFEGWDAGGKGSAIKRVTAAIDPRLYKVVPISAPTDEERSHHYLWRFWRHLPRTGRFVIFDRSWYGRVLVERVEGFAKPEEWKRAFLEINDFEEQLTDAGIAVAKFWMHISKDEQLRRFKARETNSVKQYKITKDDWRNRKKWDAYKEAVNDMVGHTSTEFAPWTLVAGNDKKWAHVQVLKTLCDRLETVL